MAAGSKRLTIDVNETTQVSGLLEIAKGSKLCLVLAHGAGAGMEHPSMAAIAQDLAARDIATLRYQFPYMERSEKRTDAPPLCHATVRAAVAEAARRTDVPLFAGGRSFGGRMCSMAAAEGLKVAALVLVSYPLHPPGRPERLRTEHFAALRLPCLFVSGRRDAFATPEELELIRVVLDPGSLRDREVKR